jgi:large repetitive protein
MRGVKRGVALALGSAALVAGCFTSYSTSPGGNGADGGAGGYGSDGAIANGSGTLSATSLDFGMVSCGSAGTAQTVTIQNTGTTPVTWSASVDSLFTVQGSSSGTVAPGASGTLTVSSSTVPLTSDPGVVIKGTLTVITNIPGLTSATLPLTLTPQGGSLVVSPSLVGFGTVELATVGALPINVQNLGNAPVHVTFGTPSNPVFAATYTGAPAAAVIAPGMSLAGASATFTPTATTATTGSIPITTTDPLCASGASAISLSGSGTSAPVSIGPNPVDFGAVPCGQTGAAQLVTIKNGYSAAITFQATLGMSPSPFSLSATSGPVPAKGSTTITVTPAPIPFPASTTAGAYEDTLTVTTTAPNAPSVALALTQVPAGAVLTLTAASTAFGMVAGTTATLPITVTNSGTIAAGLTLVGAGPGFDGVFTGSNLAAPDGGTALGNATFTPQSNGPASGTVSVTTSVALCAPLPPALAFTAVGTVPIASFPSTGLTTGYAPSFCPPGDSVPATLSIENTGSAPLLLSGATAGGGYLSIVSSTATPIPPGQTGTIVVQGAFPATYQGGSVQGTLTFSTNEPGAPSYSVPVTINFLANC